MFSCTGHKCREDTECNCDFILFFAKRYHLLLCCYVLLSRSFTEITSQDTGPVWPWSRDLSALGQLVTESNGYFPSFLAAFLNVHSTLDRCPCSQTEDCGYLGKLFCRFFCTENKKVFWEIQLIFNLHFRIS
jgi:hypothetical protein